MASSDSQKADQIAFHFYTKLFYVVNHARTTNPLPPKLDKWFNLETPDSDLFTKEEREPYKSISSAPPPPLEIQVLLTIPELAHNQVLVHLSPDSSRVRIHPTPRFVLLETFILNFIPGPPVDVPLPTIYKHGIPLFRSLYTLLRVLPAWKLHKRLRRRAASLGITLRVRNGHDPDVLTLTNAESKSHTFPPLPHPMGTLSISMTYLASPTFQLDELESLLSSRFLSLDNRPFTPTLAKNSAGSSSTSPPRSPPRQPSSLPRSSLGRQSITAATLSTPPPTRTQVLRQVDSSTSSLSPSNSFYTSTAGQDTQPRPRYPFPFKSNTVSTTTFPSSSLGLPSSLTDRISLSDRVAQYDRERERVGSLPHTHTPDLSSGSPHRTGPVPLHVRQPSLSRPRESPEDPSASTSTSTSASTSGRKRYSSSFGHRYAPSVPAPSPSPSSPSPAPSPSSPTHPRPPLGRSSISTPVRTDDEDISMFVQDIDTRKPLVGRARTPVSAGGSGSGSPRPPEPESERLDEFPAQSVVGVGVRTGTPPPPPPPQQSPPGGQMLTSEAEVDIRLRRMNETFLRSLEGLGSGSAAGSVRQRSHTHTQSPGGLFSGAREREREREREQERGDRVWESGREGGGSGSAPWGEIPGKLVRQGSQEVVGRMELEVFGAEAEAEGHGVGGGRGSGGRFVF